MKATIEFNLPEEATEQRDAIDGWQWRRIVWELYYEILRGAWKYGDDEQRAEFAREIWTKVQAWINERGLTLGD